MLHSVRNDTFTSDPSENANWTIIIRNADAQVVRNFAGSGSLISQNWSGDDDAELPLPDGIYVYKIEAVSTVTLQTAAPVIGKLELKSGIPIVKIISPEQYVQVGTEDTIDITGTAKSATLSSYTLEYGAGEYPQTWNTITTGTSSIEDSFIASWSTSGLTEPVYTLRLRAIDTGGDQAEDIVNIKVFKILSVSDTPDPFSPNGDSIKDTTTISASANHPIEWILTIKDPSEETVKTFTYPVSTSISQVWDGTNEISMLMPDDIYTYYVDSTNPIISGLQRSGTVTIDTIPPVANIASPVNNENIFMNVDITGTAQDNNLSSYVVEYGAGTSPSVWTTINTGSSNVIDGILATWNTLPIANGEYTLRLRVEDGAGNKSSASVVVNVDNIHITNVSVTPQKIDPVNAETCMISYTIDNDAHVTLTIYDERTKNPVRNLLDNQSQTSGSHTVEWDGRNDSGIVLPMEAYYFVISAESTLGSIGKYNDAANPVCGPQPNSYSRSVSPLSFDPYKNETVEIRYSLSYIGRMRVVINPSIKTIVNNEPRSAGESIELWDGRDANGNIHNSSYNVYFAYPQSLPRDVIILQNSTLKISNLHTEAYLIIPSNSQITTLYYTLTSDANITITIEDSNGNYFRTLVDNQPQIAETHTIEWDGKDDNGKLAFLEGDYRVKITATDTATGISFSRTASIMVYKK